jgi:hypothetical protein
VAISAMTGMGSARLNLIKGAFIAGAVGASSGVLWFRQTDDALLGVDSIGGAALQVLFWAFPGLVLYFLLARSPTLVVGEGALLVALLVTQWWSSASDGHSTASLGPALTGWYVIPSIVIVGRVVPSVWCCWRSSSFRSRRFLVVLIALTCLATFVLGPLAWLVGLAVGAFWLPRLEPDKGTSWARSD